MADPNEVAKAKVTVEADISDLKREVQEGINETEKLGDASDRTSEKVSRGFKKGAKESREMGKSLTRLQETFSKLLIPVALFTGIATLITRIIAARKEAEKFRKELEALSDVPLDKLRAALLDESFDKLGKQVADLELERRAAIEKTLEIFETKTQNIGNALKSGLKDITGIDLGFDRDEAAIEVEKAIERINRAYDSLIAKRKEAFDIEKEQQIAKIAEDAARISAARRRAEADELERNGRIEEAFAIRRRELLSEYRRELQALRDEQEAFAKEYGDEAARVFGVLIASVSRSQQQALTQLQRDMDSTINAMVNSIERLETTLTSGSFVTSIDALTQATREVSTGVRRLK